MNELVYFFDTLFDAMDLNDFEIPKWVGPKYAGITFPPVNAFIHKNKDLEFEFALAGYGEDDISIEFDGDYMVLRLKGGKQKEEIEWIKRGIKNVDTQCQFYVPSNKYDHTNAKAELKNGILSIKIPSRVKKEVVSLKIKKV